MTDVLGNVTDVQKTLSYHGGKLGGWFLRMGVTALVAGTVLVLLQPNGAFHDARTCELAMAIMRECIAVGRAEGARLDDAIMQRERRRTPDQAREVAQ